VPAPGNPDSIRGVPPPTTLVPRWLAALVLAALLASGAISAWLILAPAP
jgi:hypothetical protein